VLLTCKLLVKLGYRGERPIELPSSWFPSKGPSGSQSFWWQFRVVKIMIRAFGRPCPLDLFSNFECTVSPFALGLALGENDTRLVGHHW
jgi:hypothetical protein